MFPSDTPLGTIHPRGHHQKDVHSAFALTVSGGATPNDTSDEVIVKGADQISIYGKCITSTNLDIEVYTTYKKGGDFTNKPYASMNLGAGESDQLPITPGMYGLKIKIINNDAANAATVDTGVLADWR